MCACMHTSVCLFLWSILSYFFIGQIPGLHTFHIISIAQKFPCNHSMTCQLLPRMGQHFLHLQVMPTLSVLINSAHLGPSIPSPSHSLYWPQIHYVFYFLESTVGTCTTLWRILHQHTNHGQQPDAKWRTDFSLFLKLLSHIGEVYLSLGCLRNPEPSNKRDIWDVTKTMLFMHSKDPKSVCHHMGFWKFY